jgi:Ca-activated chloride channel family protein
MRYILILLFSAAASSFSLLINEEIEVSGKVVDASTGDPVASASITLKDGSVSTTTAADGTFSLKVPAGTKTILVSYVGYELKRVSLKKTTTNLIIRLKTATNRLEEVVVLGYGVTQDAEVGLPTSPNRGYNKSHGGHQPYNNYSPQDFNTEDYDAITENRFHEAGITPLSTFSVDVDGASYSNVRRFLQQNQLPPAGSVRIEEMINYFRYDYPQPTGKHPFSVNTEVGECPWNRDHRLVMIGLQGKKINVSSLPASNLVFLIDVSGSMMDPNKLPLVKSSLKLLVEQLREEDRVSIVVYAGNAGLVLPSTSGSNKGRITTAIDALEAGGSTAGGAGIRLAYSVAKKNFREDGNNRVILCTDGDFNVGVSSDAELERIIEQERESGVYLTVLGFGMGNYKDNKMQKLADKGNGNHSYIDNITEAKKVLVSEFGGTLFTIAKDVKLQVEFNPAVVQAYRLVGYENRLLNKEDFNNDRKDAGDIGSGHTVTALYEIIPVGVKSKWIEKVDPLKYQANAYKPVSARTEMLNIKIRYKSPESKSSVLLEHPVQSGTANKLSANFRFVTAVAQYGMLLNNSEFKQSSSFTSARQLASKGVGNDAEGYRKEFLELIDIAETLSEEEREN